MRQRPFFAGFSARAWAPAAALLAALALAAVTGASCDRDGGQGPADGPARPPATRPTVASLVPAATDLLVGMSAAGHLVGISNHDPDRPELRGLPRVGDYRDADWEKLAALRPDVMVIFMAPDRMPAAFRERAGQLGVRLLNVRTETLADVFAELKELAEAVGEPAKGAEAEGRLRAELDAVRARVAERPRPRVLLARDASVPEEVVGTGNFLDDVLAIAGGANAVERAGWPTLDREQLLAARPDVVIVLLPNAPPHVVAEARKRWEGLGELPAVRAGRVHVLTDWHVQTPGTKLGALAGQLAEAIHGGR